MKCFYPFFKSTAEGVVAFPCGRCHSCRASQSMIWSLRMHLESLYHNENAFVTLTYANEFLPEHNSLTPSHLQGFFKRLRRKLPYKIRYFACGEYGDRFGRAHYHAIIFGLKKSDFHLIDEAWKFGLTHTEIPSQEAFQYVAGYVTKKIGKVSDWKLKNPNQVPPFQRCSLGLGLRFIMEQVPFFTNVLQIGDKTRYIGRYLRNKLAEKFGILEKVKENGLKLLSADLQTILSEFYYHGNNLPDVALKLDRFADYRKAWQWKYQGYIDDFLARMKIRLKTYRSSHESTENFGFNRGYP